MIQRQVLGPQDRFERTGAQSLRDIRPFAVRLSEVLRSSASGILLGMGATATFFEPAAVNITVPVSIAYAAWVLTRRVQLPIRLPKTSGLPDYSSPEPGSRKPKKADATFFIGWDLEGRELWGDVRGRTAAHDDPGHDRCRQDNDNHQPSHQRPCARLGLRPRRRQGPTRRVWKVLALARRFGREDDVRVLNLMVASGLKDSHTWNPFATGNADAIREILASQLGEQAEKDSNGVFRDRAVALIGTIAPVLVWLRDNKGLHLNIEVIRFSIELSWIWKLAMKKIVRLRDTETGVITEIDVSEDIPETITWPLRSYLGELPGYDAELPLDQQRDNKPSEQHGYAQFYFTPMFTQIGGSLGHIFNVESGDIDMRDIVLNRRILVVNLPTLENSPVTLAALGKLVVTSLRGMMAQLLGVSLEGDYSEANKPGMGESPFHIVLDEMAYYATSGLDAMLAMGRGLNISFMLGFQEVSGIWARLGEKTASLLGNANLTIAMRQQDSGRTRDWLEKTAGQTNVTQATSYQGASDGNYREARHAEVRTVSRVDWNDLTSLIEGEAIVLFGGRRIYTRVFHAKIDDKGPKRLGRSIMLANPDPKDLRSRLDAVRAIAANIESGSVSAGSLAELSPGLKALLQGFARASRSGSHAQGCAQAALDEICKLPDDKLPSPPPPPSDGSPVTGVTHMLATSTERVFAGPDPVGLPNEPIDDRLLRGIAAVERASGVVGAHARGAALSILKARDEALDDTVVVEPPKMPPEVLEQHIRAIIRQLEGLQVAAKPRKAA